MTKIKTNRIFNSSSRYVHADVTFKVAKSNPFGYIWDQIRSLFRR